ncbi:MAG: enoyl-CoA hydratase/isomerase family protein, partial [Firmicutes bacterium]|nr:enoyl-CoA hydratase/isomerase family protein [Bacillota bacterium]
MEFRDLTFTREGPVGLITLNRPAVLNALRRETIEDLTAVFREAGLDEGLRCVVLTGAGKAFSAGQDLAELSGMAQQKVDYYALRENAKQMQELTKAML